MVCLLIPCWLPASRSGLRNLTRAHAISASSYHFQLPSTAVCALGHGLLWHRWPQTQGQAGLHIALENGAWAGVGWIAACRSVCFRCLNRLASLGFWLDIWLLSVSFPVPSASFQFCPLVGTVFELQLLRAPCQ